MPRPNGYQSLHTSVVSERGFPFEVQIRTAEMHRIAEEGIAAHWKYKEGRVGADRDEQYFLWLRQLLEWQQEVRDPQEFLQNLQDRALPGGGLHLHAEGGGEGAAARRDAGRLRLLRSTPTSATSASARASTARWCRCAPGCATATSSRSSRTPGHKPSRDWLNFVATSRARNKIKHFIHAEEKIRSLELGRKLFDKEARRFGLNVKTLTEGERFAAVLAEGGLQKADELFAAHRLRQAVGEGGAGQAGAAGPAEGEPPESALSSVVKRVLGTGEEKIKVRGIDDLMVFRARCCNPIRGEKIVGYITRGKGVSVHSATCPNVVNLLYDPERRIDVEWDKGDRRVAVHGPPEHPGRGSQGHPRRRQLEDRRHQHQHPQRRSDGRPISMGRIDMTVEISDVKHLQKVIKSLRSVEGCWSSVRERELGQTQPRLPTSASCSWDSLSLDVGFG